MRSLSAAELLSVWEHAIGQPPFHQALVLLAAVYPEISVKDLAQLSIGERDARLLALHERLFGSRLDSLTVCPHCDERIELSFSVQDIGSAAQALQTPSEHSGEVMALAADRYKVRFRHPNSLDMMALDASCELSEARMQLLKRCIVSIEQDGQDNAEINDASLLPAAVIDAVAEYLAQADPQANTQLALACPACGHRWQAVFDIAPYLASEIGSWAQRTLREVHTLALTYGWDEADLLAMSPIRRQAYLEMLGYG